jgi:catechol 2,3-dioxygenase-like lactoylglutathione lyase family enzyme
MAAKLELVSLVQVKKMDRAIEFYRKNLGAKVVMRGTGPMKDYWSSLEVAGANVWLVRGGPAEKRKLAYHAFVTKDIRKFVATLKRRKVRFDKAERSTPDTKVEGEIAFEGFGASAFFHDTEGNLLMAWQTMMAM